MAVLVKSDNHAFVWTPENAGALLLLAAAGRDAKCRNSRDANNTKVIRKGNHKQEDAAIQVELSQRRTPEMSRDASNNWKPGVGRTPEAGNFF